MLLFVAIPIFNYRVVGVAKVVDDVVTEDIAAIAVSLLSMSLKMADSSESL